MNALIPLYRGRLPAGGRRASLCAFAVVLFTVAPVFGQSTELLTAEQVEAGFIYNFIKYTEWPLRTDNDKTRFHICVAGDGGVAGQLDNLVNGKAVGSRNIVVRHLEDSSEITDCRILYVGRVARKLEDRLIPLLSGQAILTVGSTPGYLRGAGIITFVIEGNRVRFDINAKLAERVNIRFDSRILVLARNKNETSR